METPLFIAQVLTLCYLSIGIGFFVSRDYYQREITKLFENPGFILLGGYVSLIIGALILHTQNTWIAYWTTIITAIGWIAIIKGIWLIVFPKSVQHYKKWLQGRYLNTIGTLMILLGLMFFYFGFWL